MRNWIAVLVLGASAALAQSPAPGDLPLSPEQALRAFKVAPGFHVELVASEPLVDHPVAMDIDPEGRLWVAEMPGYMKDAKASGLTAPTGRIVVLEDTDGDGKMDRRTVFLDGLVLPRTVRVIGRGALVGEPPHLWYCPDEDGDMKADRKIAVASDYFLRADNPELGPNTALVDLDNWIYHAQYSSRLRWQKGGSFAREGDIERGQWGLSQDDSGRLYYDNNHDQLHADLVPGHYYIRNPSSLTHSGVDMPLTTDQTIWPARPTPDVNEAYKPEMMRPDGTLKAFTAACAPTVYRGNAYPPEFAGNAFVCEPACNLVKRDLVRENGLMLEARPAYEKSEWLASTDPWFRPVNLANAPDGTLHVVDMAKGIILFKPFWSEHLKKILSARKDPPGPLGRIWRVVPDGQRPPTPAPKLSTASTADLIRTLGHPSGWWRDTAQRLLVERADPAAVAPLKELVLGTSPRLARLHALWTLEGMGALDQGTVLAALRDTDRKIRAAGVRLSEPFLRGPTPGEVETAVRGLVKDRLREVRVQVAFTLGEATSPAARAAQLTMLENESGDIFVADALLSGMRGRELDALAALGKSPAWAVSKPGPVRTLRGLAQCVGHARIPADVAQLISMISEQTVPGWQQLAMLEGLYNAVRFGSLPPIHIATEPKALAGLAVEGSTKDRVKEVLANLTWPGKKGFVEQPPPRELTADERARYERGRALYASDCAACHQTDGMGQKGRAPPLLSSVWVNRTPEATARIVLQGVKGPITVHDTEWKMEMPSLAHLDDEQIAAILTYVRRSWGNGSDPVDAPTIARIRGAIAARHTPWTAAELDALH